MGEGKERDAATKIRPSTHEVDLITKWGHNHGTNADIFTGHIMRHKSLTGLDVLHFVHPSQIKVHLLTLMLQEFSDSEISQHIKLYLVQLDWDIDISINIYVNRAMIRLRCYLCIPKNQRGIIFQTSSNTYYAPCKSRVILSSLLGSFLHPTKWSRLSLSGLGCSIGTDANEPSSLNRRSLLCSRQTAVGNPLLSKMSACLFSLFWQIELS